MATVTTSESKSLLSASSIILGIGLLIFMITIENKPGAIPLLLIVFGCGWNFIADWNPRLKI
jgi:hypothetical protein